MQSGNSISPKDIVDIAIRRRWLILIPLFLTLIYGIYYSFTAPKIYEATTLVMVAPQQVPKDFVRSVVTDDAESMLGTISQQITSRTNLEQVINEFGLMPKNNPNVLIEDVMGRMKPNIQIKVTRNRKGSDTFSISYRGANPQKVMEITNALASNFIDTNSKIRESQASGTSTFLESELENVRERLFKMEAEIKEYRQRYMGELPEQMGSNLSVLQGLQNQLMAKEVSLRDLKSKLSETEDLAPNGAADPNDIGSLRGQLSDLMMRYTENHPDVTRLKNRIKELENAAAVNGNTDQIPISGVSRRKSALLRDQAIIENQIANFQSQIRVYQARVEETPKREQELISLKRDYDNMNNLYSSLLKRKLESEISVSMERKQIGEQFQIIDRAQLPKRPIAPDLKKIFVMTLGVGFGLGCGLAYLLEFLDSSYRKPEKVEEDFNLPIIAAIPAIYSPKALYMKRIDMGLCSLFAFIILLLIGAFSFFTLGSNDKAFEIVKKIVSV
jgi:polysaccharide chain length determinant protein (PEP-CTERM system associated)